MSLKVLGISTSPRANGNSDRLLRQALAGAEAAGAQVEYVRLSDFKIGPCTECDGCYATGICVLRDDYERILSKMLDADRLIFATPVFFMSVCAQAKILIDRGQCLWAAKYLLKKTIAPKRPDRSAMVIALGGSKSKRMFESVRLTMKSYFDSLHVRYAANLFVNRVDNCGEIEQHAEAMKQAFRLGKELAAADTPATREPVDVELT
ncbi:MAG: flavodoxin family protein [Phycisphaerales bacterium]|nr:MAG: flavodoxin family protein [Phycisphaerales bacterium]